jgi:hypothetical protein
LLNSFCNSYYFCDHLCSITSGSNFSTSKLSVWYSP